jgi:hypothetical protein
LQIGRPDTPDYGAGVAALARSLGIPDEEVRGYHCSVAA